jgi:hypothetical protein
MLHQKSVILTSCTLFKQAGALAHQTCYKKALSLVSAAAANLSFGKNCYPSACNLASICCYLNFHKIKWLRPIGYSTLVWWIFLTWVVVSRVASPANMA